MLPPREKIAQQFYIPDHALLYGFLGKYAQEQCGERGLQAFEQGTIRYARERGARMAMRCLADGRPLTMQNYILYGEWADPKGASTSHLEEVAPRYRVQVTQCCWNDTWEKWGLQAYGAIYCTHVDKNLALGFNPDSRLEVPATLSHGQGRCELEYCGANFASAGEHDRYMAQKPQIAAYAVKDFLYHTGHLLCALRGAFYLQLGVDAGEAICEKALAAYAGAMGQEKCAALRKESEKNFLLI